VDDCSPDNCPAICDEYTAKDTRFKVIHKKQNEGLPKARKSGLDIAVAEFVTHLDSDDWLEQNALEALYAKQRETDADIVMGGIKRIWYYGSRIYTYPEITYSTNILRYYFLYKCRNVWGKIYRKVLFNGYIVPDTNIGEDAMVNVQLFSKLELGKLQKIDDIVYNYDRRTNGITIKLNKQYFYNSYEEDPAIKSRLWIEKYLENIDISDTVKSAFYYYMIDEGINFYLRFNKTIKRNEVEYFYAKYYKQCSDNMMFLKKIIIPLFYRSILLGKLYVFIVNNCQVLIKTIHKYMINRR
jgi:glycosyltransferase involved in cell wall biosynthesis